MSTKIRYQSGLIHSNNTTNSTSSIYKCHDLANSIEFITLCKILQKMKSQNTETKLKIAMNLSKKIGKQSRFPLFRLIFPKLDLERKKYNVGEKKFQSIFKKALGLGDNSKAWLRLHKWKETISEMKKNGNNNEKKKKKWQRIFRWCFSSRFRGRN